MGTGERFTCCIDILIIVSKQWVCEHILIVKNKIIHKIKICIRYKNLTYSIAFMINLPDNFFPGSFC